MRLGDGYYQICFVNCKTRTCWSCQRTGKVDEWSSTFARYTKEPCTKCHPKVCYSKLGLEYYKWEIINKLCIIESITEKLEFPLCKFYNNTVNSEDAFPSMEDAQKECDFRNEQIDLAIKILEKYTR